MVEFIIYGILSVFVGTLIIYLIDSIYMAITGKSKLRR